MLFKSDIFWTEECGTGLHETEWSDMQSDNDTALVPHVVTARSPVYFQLDEAFRYDLFGRSQCLASMGEYYHWIACLALMKSKQDENGPGFGLPPDLLKQIGAFVGPAPVFWLEEGDIIVETEKTFDGQGLTRTVHWTVLRPRHPDLRIDAVGVE